MHRTQNIEEDCRLGSRAARIKLYCRSHSCTIVSKNILQRRGPLTLASQLTTGANSKSSRALDTRGSDGRRGQCSLGSQYCMFNQRDSDSSWSATKIFISLRSFDKDTKRDTRRSLNYMAISNQDATLYLVCPGQIHIPFYWCDVQCVEF